jgi:hypothetical protein
MPRELKAWRGKAPPAQPRDDAKPAAAREEPAAQTGGPPGAKPPRPSPASENTEGGGAEQTTPCPCCGRMRLRKLASGALGCLACGSVFSLQQASPATGADREEEEVGALDRMDAINEMLRSNQLALGPGGVPLAEPRAQAVPQPARRRGRNRRRVTR